MGLLAVSCDIGSVYIIDYMTSEYYILDKGASYISAITVDEENKMILIGGSADGTFRIYDLTKPKD